MRVRITIKDTGNRRNDLQTAVDLKSEVLNHVPVGLDPEHPLVGIHRDEAGRAYFEFATDYPGEIRRVIDQFHHTEQVEVLDNPPLPGEECLKCGNIPGPVQPSVCPSCGFKDITSCPVCAQPIPRDSYSPLGGNLFRCPHCRNRVWLRYNSPMVLRNGEFNQPLVVVEEATASHEVR